MPDGDDDVKGQRPRVVIVGAGFAGLTVAKRLAKAPVDITLIDRENHHLFQPLLYQVATAGLSPADIAWPIRSLVRRQRNTRVLLGAVTGVDRVRKHVVMVTNRAPLEPPNRGLMEPVEGGDFRDRKSVV